MEWEEDTQSRSQVAQPQPFGCFGTKAGDEEWESPVQLECLLCLYLLSHLGQVSALSI